MTVAKNQEQLYREAGEQFAPAIARLSNAMERDQDRARDLEQEIHCAIWKSLNRFMGDCSLKTWVFRVAHNTAADFVAAANKRPQVVHLDEVDALPIVDDAERTAAENHAIARVTELIRTLAPLDAQIILLWLEGESGAVISEVTGLSSNAAQVRIHRVKNLLAQSFRTDSKGGSTDA